MFRVRVVAEDLESLGAPRNPKFRPQSPWVMKVPLGSIPSVPLAATCTRALLPSRPLQVSRPSIQREPRSNLCGIGSISGPGNIYRIEHLFQKPVPLDRTRSPTCLPQGLILLRWPVSNQELGHFPHLSHRVSEALTRVYLDRTDNLQKRPLVIP